MAIPIHPKSSTFVSTHFDPRLNQGVLAGRRPWDETSNPANHADGGNSSILAQRVRNRIMISSESLSVIPPAPPPCICPPMDRIMTT